jgi:protein arginine N-methyltransferase 2
LQPAESWDGANEKKLMKACIEGELGEVKRLLSLTGEERVAIHWQDEANFHCTALHVAAQHGHLEVVKALLLDGAPWNMLDTNGKTAGEYAKEGGFKDVYEEVSKRLTLANISAFKHGNSLRTHIILPR